MSEARLTTPLYRVVMDDGAEHEVRIINADMVWYDRERAKHKWPPPSEAAILWQTYLTWKALRRTGVLPDMSLREYEERAWQVEGLEKDGGEIVDPTMTDPGPG